MGILEITFIVLLVLKLMGKFEKSWWIVFSPLLVSLVIYMILFFPFLGLMFITFFFSLKG